jgi:hypothetical protein
MALGMLCRLVRGNLVMRPAPQQVCCCAVGKRTVWARFAAAAGAVCLLLGGGHAVAAPPGYRELADGVLTVIPPNVAVAEMLLRDDLREATVARRDLEWKPRQAAEGSTFVRRAAGREFPRELWCLEFAFKPPRSLDIDVPVSELRMRRTRIWYVVYRVRNLAGPAGSWMRLKTESDDTATDRSRRAVERFEGPVRFVPHFVLESFEPVADGEGLLAYRSYLDRVLPTALPEIRRREDPRREYLDSASMAAAEIAPGEERWGVATWEDVDPRIDFFSISVTGLTNALQWRLAPDAEVTAADAPNAKLQEALQSLRLDFWRPGDGRQDQTGQASIGFQGMFERMTLGGRLLDDAGRPALNGSQPEAGLERLGLGWGEGGIDPGMLEPDLGDDPTVPDWGSFRPLQTVLRKTLALPDVPSRTAAVREVFGERGVASLRDLADGIAGPVDPQRDAARRAALARAGLSAEDVAKAPLAAVADLLTPLESLAPAERREVATALFGPAGDRLDWLAREVQAARALATLEDVGLPLREITRGDALAAFESLQTALQGETEPARLEARLRALFGPRGPALYRAAVAVHEGIDHAWVFRYDL